MKETNARGRKFTSVPRVQRRMNNRTVSEGDTGNEASMPPEYSDVWVSFNNVLSISTERLVHRDERFLNHEGNKNSAHM